MKNNIKEVLLFTILVISFIFVINYNNYINKQVIYSVTIWINKILPTLFPTFIIVDILINSKIPYYISKYTHINYIYVLSILSGSPTNAYLLNKYDTDITKILSVNIYTSPIFIYTFLKMIFNNYLALLLIILNIISNIILCIIINPVKLVYNNKQKPSIEVLLNSIKSNMSILINIIKKIIFFNIIYNNIIENIYIKSLILSIMEITSSLNNLLIIDIPLNIKLLFSIISISTCGLCIQTQIKSTLTDTKLCYKKFLKYRLCHLIIYLLLTLFIIKFLSCIQI